MGLASWLGFKPYAGMPDKTTHAVDQIFWDNAVPHYIDSISGMSEEQLWKDQPHLRTVVDFVARNIAQLGVHTYTKKEDGGRDRRNLAVFDRNPNPDQTPYELVWQLVADLMLYDRAYWLVLRTPTGYEIRSLRPHWVTGTQNATAYNVGGYLVMFPNQPAGASPLLIPAEQVLAFHGYHPRDALDGVSKIEALKGTLSEQVAAARFRAQMWQRGGRIGTYVTRPQAQVGTQDWSPSARQKFIRDFAAQWAGPNSNATGIPLLDEGMDLKQIRFSAREEQFVEATRLSLETCAQVYHINPTMVGQLQNANYANVREFRRALYGETLGPVVKQIEDRINAFLLPMLGVRSPKVYAEFNVEARLRGSFEEQAQVFATAIGGPWMTINEGRARQNLPSVDGGDELIKPLNVTQNGDQNSTPADPSSGTGTPDDPAQQPNDNTDSEDDSGA